MTCINYNYIYIQNNKSYKKDHHEDIPIKDSDIKNSRD